MKWTTLEWLKRDQVLNKSDQLIDCLPACLLVCVSSNFNDHSIVIEVKRYDICTIFTACTGRLSWFIYKTRIITILYLWHTYCKHACVIFSLACDILFDTYKIPGEGAKRSTFVSTEWYCRINCLILIGRQHGRANKWMCCTWFHVT